MDSDLPDKSDMSPSTFLLHCDRNPQEQGVYDTAHIVSYPQHYLVLYDWLEHSLNRF